jgi:hypothetical protein
MSYLRLSTVATQTAILVSVLAAVAAPFASAQVLTSWAAPSTDDGNPIPNFVASWSSNPATGAITNLPTLFGSQALAVDPVNRILFASTGTSLTRFNDQFVALGPPTGIVDQIGNAARPRQILSFAYGNGILYASVQQSAADQALNRGIPSGLYSINTATARATRIAAASALPLFSGMDFNHADGFIYTINGQSIVKVDTTTFQMSTVAAIPASAYNGVVTSFTGVAVGENKVFLTVGLQSGYGKVPIAVYGISEGQFLPSLPAPFRAAENCCYGAGAAYLPPVPGGTPCPADLDGDGAVGASDVSFALLDFGPCPACQSDVDGDGITGASDISLMLLDFGPCP